jgi:hypothetical protein
MREFLDSFARALNVDRTDDEYESTLRHFEKQFRDSVRDAMCDLLDPANPRFRDARLAKAIRKSVVGGHNP